MLEARLVPRPLVAVAGRRVAVFTTARAGGACRPCAAALRALGAEVVAGRPARSPTGRRCGPTWTGRWPLGADLLLTELKAAAIDVVAEAGDARGVRGRRCWTTRRWPPTGRTRWTTRCATSCWATASAR